MRRFLLISLTLVLALVGWTTVCADDGFYVISGVKRNYAPVPKTGQTASYDQNEAHPGDDGGLKKGVAWPTPRFTDHGNGTVTDNLTGLIWMKDAGVLGTKNWQDALTAAYGLAAPAAGLSDGSKAGDWRLPNVRELQSLVNYGSYNPALPASHPFTNVHKLNSDYYWSSTTYAPINGYAVLVDFYSGYGALSGVGWSGNYYVWCVRGGP